MSSSSLVTRIEPQSARQGDTIRIFIRDCAVDLRVGLYATELEQTQPVLVTIELEAALPHRYKDRSEKKLDRVIDYEPIYNFIQNELPKLGHTYLLETAAEEILDFCFRDIRVQKARVRLEKTSIFPRAAGAGIEMTRSRTVAL